MATILMVDDDPLIGQLMKISLGRLGHDVVIATRGIAGLELVRQVRPSLVILDLVLPDGEGLDILEQIHTIAPQTAVVIFTAWGSEFSERKASRLGASAFLDKGRTPGLLRSTVARILETQAAVSPGSESAG